MNSIEATIRNTNTKGEVNSLRKDGIVPAIIYGGKDQNQKVSISKKMIKTLIDNENFLNEIKEQSVKDALKDATNEAFKKEVFGAPTCIANNKIFWGQDRLEYAVEELNTN